MTLRPRAFLLSALLGLPLALLLAACNKVESITIVPAAGVEILTAVGQTAQFQAYATEQMGSAPTTTDNITNSVTWTSSNQNVATISSAGLATAVGAGVAEITATSSNNVVAYSNVTVNVATTTSGGGNIVSIAVIPNAQAVATPTQTTQFLAIGTTSTGATVDLTNLVSWNSSSTQIATIGQNTGFATAVNQGTATITAIYSASGGAVVTGTATFTISGGNTQQYTALSITPSSMSLSASGQTSQLIALATSGSTGFKTDVTSSSQIHWYSSSSSIASVGLTTGIVTGENAGSTTITAELTNPDGSVVSNTATVTVTATAAPEPLISLTVIPSTVTAGALGDTAQFLAIGTYSTAPYTRDLTNSSNLTWISTEPNYFPVSSNTGGGSGASAGIVTAITNGSAVIIAEATNPLDGTIQTANATFACPLALPNLNGNPPTAGTCNPNQIYPGLLATLTVYDEGLNSSSTSPNWLVTAPSATSATDIVIHCGPGWTNNGKTGGSVCTATYPINTVVTLTAPAQSGVVFGGWTSNCVAQGTVSATGPNTCTVTLTTNDTVGAIFN
jgi:uncharacterized protein YjdB